MNFICVLAGELEVVRARNVILFAPLTKYEKGVLGLLVVTNFKLSFLSVESSEVSVLLINNNIV